MKSLMMFVCQVFQYAQDLLAGRLKALSLRGFPHLRNVAGPFEDVLLCHCLYWTTALHFEDYVCVISASFASLWHYSVVD